MPSIRYGNEQVSVTGEYFNSFLDRIANLSVENPDRSNGLGSQINVFRSRKVMAALFNNNVTRRSIAETFKQISDDLFSEISSNEEEQIKAEEAREKEIDDFIGGLLTKIKENKVPYHPDIAAMMVEYGIDPNN